VWAERPGNSPLVRTVWSAEVEEPGSYPIVGSEYWGLSFIARPDGTLAAELDGPCLGVRVVVGIADERYWGVELGCHVFVPGVSKQAVLGQTVSLPVADGQVQLAGRQWPVPRPAEVEDWVLDLARRGGLVVDDEIYQALAGDRVGASDRTWQRRYRRTVGLTGSQVALVRRVELAYVLLQNGLPPAEAAAEAGFADQSHLTRSLRLVRGLTPAAIIARHQGR